MSLCADVAVWHRIFVNHGRYSAILVCSSMVVWFLSRIFYDAYISNNVLWMMFNSFFFINNVNATFLIWKWMHQRLLQKQQGRQINSVSIGRDNDDNIAVADTETYQTQCTNGDRKDMNSDKVRDAITSGTNTTSTTAINTTKYSASPRFGLEQMNDYTTTAKMKRLEFAMIDEHKNGDIMSRCFFLSMTCLLCLFLLRAAYEFPIHGPNHTYVYASDRSVLSDFIVITSTMFLITLFLSPWWTYCCINKERRMMETNDDFEQHQQQQEQQEQQEQLGRNDSDDGTNDDEENEQYLFTTLLLLVRIIVASVFIIIAFVQIPKLSQQIQSLTEETRSVFGITSSSWHRGYFVNKNNNNNNENDYGSLDYENTMIPENFYVGEAYVRGVTVDNYNDKDDGGNEDDDDVDNNHDTPSSSFNAASYCNADADGDSWHKQVPVHIDIVFGGNWACTAATASSTAATTINDDGDGDGDDDDSDANDNADDDSLSFCRPAIPALVPCIFWDDFLDVKYNGDYNFDDWFYTDDSNRTSYKELMNMATSEDVYEYVLMHYHTNHHDKGQDDYGEYLYNGYEDDDLYNDMTQSPPSGHYWNRPSEYIIGNCITCQAMSMSNMSNDLKVAWKKRNGLCAKLGRGIASVVVLFLLLAELMMYRKRRNGSTFRGAVQTSNDSTSKKVPLIVDNTGQASSHATIVTTANQSGIMTWRQKHRKGNQDRRNSGGKRYS